MSISRKASDDIDKLRLTMYAVNFFFFRRFKRIVGMHIFIGYDLCLRYFITAFRKPDLYRFRRGMCVDEWGSWYTCEPGTNPGFLYQQNTVRDALIAGITLNIF